MPAIAQPLPDDIAAAVECLITFARAKIQPRHERYVDILDGPRRRFREDGRLADETVAIIREMRMCGAEASFYTMCVPESLCGGGLGHLAYFAGWQALFHHCGPHQWLMLYAISHWCGPSRLLEKVGPHACEEILAPLMRGERSMCFGLSEPGAGSDVQAMRTRAVDDGEGWRLTGRKIWTTNSTIADDCIVFAVTDSERATARRGDISAFLVPTNAPGFRVDRVIRMFGSIGGDEAELAFEDVRVEPWQLVGELHERISCKPFAVPRRGRSSGRVRRSRPVRPGCRRSRDSGTGRGEGLSATFAPSSRPGFSRPATPLHKDCRYRSSSPGPFVASRHAEPPG